MGHSSRFLVLLLVTSLLFLSFDYGFGRVALMETQQDFPIRRVAKYDMEDYSDPQPNTNPKNGYVLSPPSSPTPTPTHAPSP